MGIQKHRINLENPSNLFGRRPAVWRSPVVVRALEERKGRGRGGGLWGGGDLRSIFTNSPATESPGPHHRTRGGWGARRCRAGRGYRSGSLLRGPGENQRTGEGQQNVSWRKFGVGELFGLPRRGGTSGPKTSHSVWGNKQIYHRFLGRFRPSRISIFPIGFRVTTFRRI